MIYPSFPSHIAIIMDGNGRWAQAQGLPRVAGHKKGAEVARTIIKEVSDLGIKYLTLYAFSSENWNRSEEEVSGIFKLLGLYLDQEEDKFHKMQLKLKFIGNVRKLPQELQHKIAQTETATANNKGLNLVIALSYGGREEILHACSKVLLDAEAGNLIHLSHPPHPERHLSSQNAERDGVEGSRVNLSGSFDSHFTSHKLSEVLTRDDGRLFSQALYTRDIPDPDFLIRTGGEYRLSNFLLWQVAYTELYFTKILWPDFTTQDFKVALDEFETRNRRYGR